MNDEQEIDLKKYRPIEDYKQLEKDVVTIFNDILTNIKAREYVEKHNNPKKITRNEVIDASLVICHGIFSTPELAQSKLKLTKQFADFEIEIHSEELKKHEKVSLVL